MAVIDFDAVQMLHGECKREMNVTDYTGLVLRRNGLQNSCSRGERSMGGVIAGV